MAITRLQRKGRKNKARAAQRKNTIKQLMATPVIKNNVLETSVETPPVSPK